MSEISWPIKRNEIYYGHIIKTDGRDILKQRSILFQTSSHFSTYETLSDAVDLNYDSPNYVMQYLNTNKKKNKKDSIGFYYNCRKLSYLLQYFGFNELLEKKDYIDVMRYLFNGKFAYENCSLFGYARKEPLIWKNGQLVLNPNINCQEYFDPYNYQLIDKENKLADFFPILNEVDYKNPKAIFTPFEEEGPIRKRILVGSDQDV